MAPSPTLRALSLALSLAACRDREPHAQRSAPVPIDAAPHIAIDVLPRDAATDEGTSDAAARHPHSTRAITPPHDNNRRATLVATPTGATLIEAINRPGLDTQVTALALDAEGRPTGATRLLRSTSGPVTALSASVAEGHLWLSWIALRAPSGDPRSPYELLSVALHASADLLNVDGPIVLDDESVAAPHVDTDREGWWPEERTRVFARAEGAALVVATGAVDRCEHPRVFNFPAPDGIFIACATLHESRINSDRSVSRRVRSVFAPSGAPRGFTRRHDEVAYILSTHSAFMTEGAIVRARPLERADAPGRGPDVSRYALLALAAHVDEPDVLPEQNAFDLGGGPPPTEGVFGRFDADDVLRSPFALDARHEARWIAPSLSPLHCVGGHPIATVRWRGGSLDLDPTRADPSFDLVDWFATDALHHPALTPSTPSVDQVVWAGRALVGLSEGALLRWRCSAANRLVPAIDG